MANEKDIRWLEKNLKGCKIKRELGKSNLGTLYLIQHPVYGRCVLKYFESLLTINPKFIKKILTESEAAKQIEHPYVAKIFQVDYQPRPFMIREWIKGESLEDRIKEGAFSPIIATEIMMNIALGLQAAYNFDVRHKNLKPNNIIMIGNDILKLVDFMLPPTEAYYIAPEQFEGKKSDIRSDIYALGVIYYKMITGKLPISDTPDIKKYITPSNYDLQSLPNPVKEILNKTLSKDPDQRYQDPMGFVAALRIAKQNLSMPQDKTSQSNLELQKLDELLKSPTKPTNLSKACLTTTSMVLLDKDSVAAKMKNSNEITMEIPEDSETLAAGVTNTPANFFPPEITEDTGTSSQLVEHPEGIDAEFDIAKIDIVDEVTEIAPDYQHLPAELPEFLQRALLLATDVRSLKQDNTVLSALTITFPSVYKGLVLDYLQTVLRRECWVFKETENSEKTFLSVDLELAKTLRYFNYFEDKIQNALARLPNFSTANKSMITCVQENIQEQIEEPEQHQNISKNAGVYTVFDTLMDIQEEAMERLEPEDSSSKNKTEKFKLNDQATQKFDLKDQSLTPEQNTSENNQDAATDQEKVGKKKVYIPEKTQLYDVEDMKVGMADSGLENELEDNEAEGIEYNKNIPLEINFQNPCQTRAWFKLVKEHGWEQGKHFQLESQKNSSLKNIRFMINLLALQDYERKRSGVSKVKEFFQGDYEISRFDHGGMAAVLKLTTKDETIIFLRPENYWARTKFKPYLCVRQGADGKECVYAQVPKGTEFVVKVAFEGREESLIYESRLLSNLAQEPEANKNVIGMVQQGSFLATADDNSSGQEERVGYYLMLEYASLGNMEQFSHRFPQNRLTPSISLYIVYSMLQTLHRLKSKGIVHRDIKPQNILIDGEGIPKLSDFGLAITIDQAGNQLNEERRRLLRLVDTEFLSISNRREQSQVQLKKLRERIKQINLTAEDKKFEEISVQINDFYRRINSLMEQEKTRAEGLKERYRPMSAEEIALKGEFAGSIYYAAPEQFSPSKLLTCQCDIYQLGAVFYNMLTGKPPVKGKNIAEVMGQIVMGHRPHVCDILGNTPLLETLDELAYQMMEHDPEQRLTPEKCQETMESIFLNYAEEIISDPSFTSPTKFKNDKELKIWQEKIEYANKIHKKMLPEIQKIIQQLQEKKKIVPNKEESININTLEVIYLWRPKEITPQQRFRFRCPNCTQKLQLPPIKVGKNIRCPNCQQRLIAKYKD